MDENFNTLCTIVAGVDVELKRINLRTTREKEAALGQGSSPQARLPGTRTTTPGAQMRPTNAAATTRSTSAGFSLLQRPTTTPTPVAAATQAIGQAKPSEFRCFKCNELGHTASACPKLRTSAIHDLGEGELAEVEALEDTDPENEDA
jgi:hypothetical protein